MIVQTLIMLCISNRNAMSGATLLEPPPQSVVLNASVYSNEMVMKLPIVVRLAVRNPSTAPILSIFPLDDPQTLQRRAVLFLKSKDGPELRLEHTGGYDDFVNCLELPVSYEVPPGWEQVVDKVFFPCALAAPGVLRSGRISDLLKPIDPGLYDARVEVELPDEGHLVSNSFQISICIPQGADRQAFEHVNARHFAFLVGQDWTSDAANFHRKLDGGVDVSRFSELQDVLDRFPTSSYAEWIRFRKLYLFGPEDEMLRYAREHREFPLADNLMLRAAEKYLEARRYKESRDVVDELMRLFPEGDTKQPAERLKAKLRDKS